MERKSTYSTEMRDFVVVNFWMHKKNIIKIHNIKKIDKSALQNQEPSSK